MHSVWRQPGAGGGRVCDLRGTRAITPGLAVGPTAPCLVGADLSAMGAGDSAAIWPAAAGIADESAPTGRSQGAPCLVGADLSAMGCWRQRGNLARCRGDRR